MIPTNLNCCTNRTVLKSAERKYNNKNNEVKADELLCKHESLLVSITSPGGLWSKLPNSKHSRDSVPIIF